MKKLLILLLTGFIIVSCNNGSAKTKELKGNTQITGTFEKGKGKVITAGKLNERRQMQELDKDSLTGNSFALGFDLEKPEVLYLQIPSERSSLPVFVEPGNKIELKINGNLDQVEFVKAPEATKAFQDFILLMDKYNQKESELGKLYQEAAGKQDRASMENVKEQYNSLQEEKQTAMYQWAEKNTGNLASAVILESLSSSPDADFNKLKAIYDKMPENIQKSVYAQNANKNIQQGLLTAIGQKAPDFAAPTPEGDTLRMSDILKKSKVLILDFWASWCRPCRVENPYVVEIYKKYHDKGLNILGISLDRPGDKDKWVKAIKDDKLNWYHVSHLQYWQEPIARQYGVMSIPATFILDKNGVIRAKNLRRDKLEAKIKELLNE